MSVKEIIHQPFLFCSIFGRCCMLVLQNVYIYIIYLFIYFSALWATQVFCWTLSHKCHRMFMLTVSPWGMNSWFTTLWLSKMTSRLLVFLSPGSQTLLVKSAEKCSNAEAQKQNWMFAFCLRLRCVMKWQSAQCAWSEGSVVNSSYWA